MQQVRLLVHARRTLLPHPSILLVAQGSSMAAFPVPGKRVHLTMLRSLPLAAGRQGLRGDAHPCLPLAARVSVGSHLASHEGSYLKQKLSGNTDSSVQLYGRQTAIVMQHGEVAYKVEQSSRCRPQTHQVCQMHSTADGHQGSTSIATAPWILTWSRKQASAFGLLEGQPQEALRLLVQRGVRVHTARWWPRREGSLRAEGSLHAAMHHDQPTRGPARA
jgi:hypothetical protein